MDQIVESIRAEYTRYKALAEAALGQVGEAELCASGPNGGNSIAVICWHLSGNFASRFTEFLTSDGEKPWRQREEEFKPRTVSRAELMARWEQGWTTVFEALADLKDDDLGRTVTIRRQPLLVHQALHRSLAHAAYHVGQIVYAAKSIRGARWTYLSIPPGGSEAYNENPRFERPEGHVERLKSPNAANGGSDAER